MTSRWMERTRAGVRDLAAFVWPERCPGCGAPPVEHGLLCAGCLDRIPRLALPLCVECLEREAADPVCSRHAGFQVRPARVYDERCALLIEAFKYSQRTDLAAMLGRELARVAPPAPAVDLVTEVPLHPARARERGYDHAALLAAALASACGRPHVPGVLERVRATPPQARLGPAARRRNLRGAFRVRHPERFRDRRVLLVDDVVTTGSTLHAALAALRGAGVRAEAVVVGWAQ